MSYVAFALRFFIVVNDDDTFAHSETLPHIRVRVWVNVNGVKVLGVKGNTLTFSG